MAAQTHTEDPRTGCWTPAEGLTAEDVYKLHRTELPHGSELVELCPTDGCVNPGHHRPTFYVGAEPVETGDPGAGPPLTEDEVQQSLTAATAETVPSPQPLIKRGPGRPRKNPR